MLTIKRPKIEVIRQVRLKAHFLPMMSTEKPKPNAPILNRQYVLRLVAANELTLDRHYQEWGADLIGRLQHQIPA